jgi:dihydropteroate synthase
MAVINRTPDSFYDQGSTYEQGAAIAAADSAVRAGAEILDVGGVKAGPGDEVTVAEEIRRVVPVVAALRERHPGVVLSVDTWRAPVGAAVAAVGADLLNDAWGGADPDLAHVAAEHGLGLVCAHAGGLAPRQRPHRPAHPHLAGAVISSLAAEAERAVAAGVSPDRIVIDPAHDFGKNTWQSLDVTRRLGEMVATGWPVLVSLSNKDFIGETLNAPPDRRLTGTLATTAICAWLGARVFRVHQVRETREVLAMVSAIHGEQRPARTVRGLA